MINYEYFVFFCYCGNELKTDKDRKVVCSKCARSYEIEMMPQKYLISRKEKSDSIDKR
jgi:DNA-directed RNA polymerase subunit M/transcription elongation factor TFIIS